MTPLRFDDHAIVLHPTGPRVLLLSVGGGWSLPHFVSAEKHYWQDVVHINRAVRERLGFNVTTLRCVSTKYDTATGCIANVYALENHGPERSLPDGGRWVAREELDDLPLVVPEHRGALESWYAWAEASDVSTLRVPWFETGWFDAATEWIQSQLERLGFAAASPVEQLRSWQRSAILRVQTAAGYLYFKAVPPMFAGEMAVTLMLADQYPERSPDLLAVDPERGWMLMRDFGGQPLPRISDIRRWEESLRLYADLQIGLVERTQDLLALGCHDLRLDKMAERADALLADESAMLAGTVWGLSESEIAELRALAPQVKAMCVKLQDYGVPETLEHGDLWPQQIVVRDDGCLFTDWSDGSVTHPFFSFAPFLYPDSEIDNELADFSGARSRLRDAYLEPWTRYAPKGRLIEAFELAQPLADLHHAIIYHRIILPRMEVRWEMENALPWYLKMLLGRRERFTNVRP